MQRTRFANYLIATVALALSIDVGIAEAPKDAVMVTPSELQWKPGRVPGPEVALLFGDDSKPGQYVYRVKFPPNFKIEAHGHPDNRRYTIISGTWYIGWGKNLTSPS